MSRSYVDGIEAKASHNVASSLTADLIAGDEDTAIISVVCPDRWFLGDFAVVTSHGGIPFAGEVESMDVCTGEVTIRGVGQRARKLPRYPVSARRVSAGGLRTPSSRCLVVRCQSRSSSPEAA